ncbi:hypothetical protein [Rhodococcus sp. 24CO]|uniref:hypothetical protein n=1 Tax=Rhodococcus sp. 24CO TaxID=3117460 RepID=UPI003D34E317
MSAITDYFTAPSDAVAATALDDGPIDPVQAKRVDPVVSLSRLESVLTGRTYDEITAEPRRGSLVAVNDDGDTYILTVADDLRDALAGLDAEGVMAAARAWTIDETIEPSEESVPFLTALADLATGAVRRGDSIYCHMVI